MTTGLTPPLIRAARAQDEDVATRLLLESGGVIYPRFAGSSETALRILRAGYRRPGHTASAEVVTVAERSGAVAGVIAAFPVLEGSVRAYRYLRLSLRGCRRGAGRGRGGCSARCAGRLSRTTLYVDAVATAADQRRAGVASALADARERGCTHLALETELENAGARSLYGQQGFEEAGRLPPVGRGLGEGYVCLVRAL